MRQQRRRSHRNQCFPRSAPAWLACRQSSCVRVRNMRRQPHRAAQVHRQRNHCSHRLPSSQTSAHCPLLEIAHRDRLLQQSHLSRPRLPHSILNRPASAACARSSPSRSLATRLQAILYSRHRCTLEIHLVSLRRHRLSALESVIRAMGPRARARCFQGPTPLLRLAPGRSSLARILLRNPALVHFSLVRTPWCHQVQAHFSLVQTPSLHRARGRSSPVSLSHLRGQGRFFLAQTRFPNRAPCRLHLKPLGRMLLHLDPDSALLVHNKLARCSRRPPARSRSHKQFPSQIHNYLQSTHRTRVLLVHNQQVSLDSSHSSRQAHLAIA